MKSEQQPTCTDASGLDESSLLMLDGLGALPLTVGEAAAGLAGPLRERLVAGPRRACVPPLRFTRCEACASGCPAAMA